MTICPSGELGDGVLDARGELGDLGDEVLERGRERSHEFALGLGFEFTGVAGGRGAQAREQLGGAAAAAVAMLGEEGGQALLAERAALSGVG